MSESVVPQPKRPGVVQISIAVLLTVVFAVKAIRWWVAVSAGTMAVGEMTSWMWVKVAFYHVAVVAGVVTIVEMLRIRQRPGGAAPGTIGSDRSFPE